MTPIQRLMLCLLGSAAVAACDKQNTSVIQSPPKPHPYEIMVCVKKKQGEIWSSEYGKGPGFHSIQSECDQHNPTALLIAKCTHQYAEYVKDLEQKATIRAEEECKKDLQRYRH